MHLDNDEENDNFTFYSHIIMLMQSAKEWLIFHA